MHLLMPDRLFDRCWARTVTERARDRLHARYSSAADVELMNEAVVVTPIRRSVACACVTSTTVTASPA
jgi:hypothetical protein